MRFTALLFIPFLALGCSSSSSDSSPTSTSQAQLSASDFSQDCNVDADCVPAWSGDVCGERNCFCANGAIAASAEDAYQAKLKAEIDACDPAATPKTCNCPNEFAQCDVATKKCVLH